MWYSFSDRQGLVDIFNGATPNVKFSEGLFDPKFEGELCLCWGGSGSAGRDLPTTIICHNETKDFLAWCATYLKGFRPITSFVRVMDVQQYLSYQRGGQQEKEVTQEYDSSWIGAIIGETLDTFPNVIKNQEIPLSGCTNSFLFIAKKTGNSWRTEEDIDGLYERWVNAIRITQGNSERKNYSNGKTVRLEAASVLSSLQSASSNRSLDSRRLVEVCLAISEGGYRLKEAFREAYPDSFEYFEAMTSGTREARLEAYEAFLASFHSQRIDNSRNSFLAGLCLSLVAPGSLEYAGILNNKREIFPSALIWYGLCAGLTRKNYIYSQFGAIGRRIQKESRFRETIVDPPRCDISFDEIKLYQDPSRWHEYVRPKYPGYLLIEIIPNGNIIVRTTTPAKPTEQPTLFERDDNRGENELGREFEFHLGRLRSIFQLASNKESDSRRNKRPKKY